MSMRRYPGRPCGSGFLRSPIDTGVGRVAGPEPPALSAFEADGRFLATAVDRLCGFDSHCGVVTLHRVHAEPAVGITRRDEEQVGRAAFTDHAFRGERDAFGKP